MPAGVFVFPDLAKLNLFNATNLLNATAANWRLALVASGWTPNNTTDELWAAASGNEIANGQGYSTGGIALTSVALTQTGGVVKFTSAAAVWNATGTGIPAWRRGVVYYLGTLNGKVNPMLGHFLGDSAPADVPLTTAGNPLTVTPHANGILSAT
ncbi:MULTISPECIES: hypothetical protein [unclassified Variovorax]|uniref:hypothetical protein n=1 Tax=unclassified Variovorax TaxID=663243 RepID=UPI00076CCB4B|nr:MULTISPECIES: hypothetical protein [unclassified Variovorax]KWT94676.1 hypothetical protein APY03_2551 [Variovorax sp. WDL1]PNG53185.1 hypothetical protein CHC06_04530 [Variovorax sp. B2]PNG53757.1 hypothetical protein CHC07_03577 [Variovorax sp. B4]VTV11209.1 hypothetical protein WDL1CHR_02091 [Variovorax sp. WDL1]